MSIFSTPELLNIQTVKKPPNVIKYGFRVERYISSALSFAVHS